LVLVTLPVEVRVTSKPVPAGAGIVANRPMVYVVPVEPTYETGFVGNPVFEYFRSNP